MWIIWRMRNASVFYETPVSLQKALEDVKGVSFIWVKKRLKSHSIAWANWKAFNVFSVV
ncbi:hypothetical protein Hdeb2414_s0057g00758611 [Helianthus debilis subsp. tardiflorus]